MEKASLESNSRGILLDNYLYHGSPYKLDIIEPRLSPCDKEPFVYASNQYEFALFYAGNDTNDLEINQSYYNGVYMLTEILPGMFRKILDRPGYVYCVPSESFEQIKYDEFVSRVAVKPIKTIRVSNVLKALTKRAEMFWFPSLPPFIDNRWDYARKRCELFGDSYDEWKRRYVELYKEWRSCRD